MHTQQSLTRHNLVYFPEHAQPVDTLWVFPWAGAGLEDAMLLDTPCCSSRQSPGFKGQRAPADRRQHMISFCSMA